jgi:hypothetical protein
MSQQRLVFHIPCSEAKTIRLSIAHKLIVGPISIFPSVLTRLADNFFITPCLGLMPVRLTTSAGNHRTTSVSALVMNISTECVLSTPCCRLLSRRPAVRLCAGTAKKRH